MPSIPILMYHSLDSSGSVISVAPQMFAEQMHCLADLGMRGVALRDAVAYREAHGSWPVGCAVLTFDDGYRNFCDAAMPALARHGFAATIFAVSGHLGGANDWAPAPPGLGTQPILTSAELRTLAAAGIEIGAHTRSHADLQHLSARQAEDEIVASRVDLETQLGQRVASFAYPFGHLTAAAVDIARRDFQAACTTVLGRAADDPLHQLPRVDMYYIRTRKTLERLLTGRLDLYLAVRRCGRAVRELWGR